MGKKINIEAIPDGVGHNLLGTEPILFHCHFFNLYLQQTVLDAKSFGDTPSILYKGALAVSFNSLKNLIGGGKLEPSEKLDIAKDVFKKLGFGIFDFSDLKESGGVVRAPSSHYASGHLAIHRRTSKESVCHFAAGAISAAASVAYGAPAGAYAVLETKCRAKGDKQCEFEVRRRETEMITQKSPGNYEVKKNPLNLEEGKWGNIDYRSVLEALKGLKLEGNDEGLIPAFGVILTNMFGNYYNWIVYKTVELILEKGEEQLARDLFVESGHICGFNTLGGIMESAEWDAIVKPMIRTEEDWIYGIVAVMNGLGWGQYIVEELRPREYLRIRAQNHYEPLGFLPMYEKANLETCYLIIGISAALMNLVYKGKIYQKPPLTPELYIFLFRQGDMFVGKEVKCVNRGDNSCVFEAHWGKRD